MIKTMDDVGRIAIPKDLRRSLRWMGGDEIEIIDNQDGSITLRKFLPDLAQKVIAIREEIEADTGRPLDANVSLKFDELIETLKEIE